MSYSMLIDTSSQMYRAFFALPATIVDADGAPVNAVHGYLDMTARLLTSYQPDRIVHVFDHDWRPAPRVAAYAGYKADRPDDPPALPPQFDLLRKVLAALGAEQAESPGWEADDAIGALCAREPAGNRVDVVTGDRDLLQLVREGKRAATIRLLMPARGAGEAAVYDRAAVLESYGVPPERYVDFATLRGDPSDGLPGVKGIGAKTARALVEQFGSLDELLAAADTLKPRIAASLREAAPYLAAMRDVVPIRTDVDVELSVGERDDALLSQLGEQFRLGGPIGRLLAAEK